ncbi:MAG: helix-turn-helix transcriptional regulator, partial [Candidatus Heimdallarchaeota archaeon]|nr:helix-turn-helix transcriptional regulator [Candidatus Heimdallarchaeota archaeon]
GYRGCKRCKSEYYPMLKPNWLQSLTRSLTNIPLDELNINKIQELSMVSYSTVHRNFKKYLNTTPNNYIQNLKMKQAIKLIKEGVDLTTVGFLCGYNSVSGFRHSFIQKFGVTPGTLKI